MDRTILPAAARSQWRQIARLFVLDDSGDSAVGNRKLLAQRQIAADPDDRHQSAPSRSWLAPEPTRRKRAAYLATMAWFRRGIVL